MKVIFIHGINQQKFNATSFQSYWLDVFKLGLEKNHFSMDIHNLNLAFPFYGDILQDYQAHNGILHKWQFLKQKNAIQEALLDIPLLPHYAKNQHLSIKNKALFVSQYLKDRILKEVLLLLNQFPKLHESLVQKFISETYLYWHNTDFQNDIHHRIMSCFEPNEEHIIVSHSLGTVVAYNLLAQLNGHYKIRRFITLASPLNFKVIQKHLKHVNFNEKGLYGKWYNFYSRDDYLTTSALNAKKFDIGSSIINKKIRTFVDKPHAILGYLQHPSVIRCILEKMPSKQTK